eukprot:737814-Prymnesium_polylepis.2
MSTETFHLGCTHAISKGAHAPASAATSIASGAGGQGSAASCTATWASRGSRSSSKLRRAPHAGLAARPRARAAHLAGPACALEAGPAARREGATGFVGGGEGAMGRGAVSLAEATVAVVKLGMGGGFLT